MNKQFKKTVIATAMFGSVTISSVASAGVITASFDGLYTILFPTGAPFGNTDNTDGPWYGQRSVVTGTMSFDTNTGLGTGTIAPFSFLTGGPLSATNITFQAIGDGSGGPGTLVLGNMGFNWNGTNGIGVSLVWDAAGFFGAVAGGLTTSDTITGGALPATDAQLFGSGMSQYTLPIGPSPMATTTFNTTTITNTMGTTPLGTVPSGSLPLIVDTLSIGGSPMPNGPFKNNNVNFDITSIHIDSIESKVVVPVPAAVWLFGSGLLGMAGVARRRKSREFAAMNNYMK